MEGGKSVCVAVFLFFVSSWGKKNAFWGILQHEQQVIAVARHILTTGLENVFKVGSVKFANSLSPPSICEEITHQK